MRIVEFEDGTYGIVRGFIFKEFADLKTSGNHWWRSSHKYFKDCKGTLQEAEYTYNKHSKPVAKIKRYL